MPGASSNAAKWWSRLEPARWPGPKERRADDPRLGEIVEAWNGTIGPLLPGRGVLVGFPIDAGVRRNGGRPGAARAPDEIRAWLARLTPWDGLHNLELASPLDFGNVPGNLEKAQKTLGDAVSAILAKGAVPVVLGGGHETAFGHYLGYAAARRTVGIINIDAHLDVRPCINGRGHSGSPFRQALEHAEHPLPGPRYVCLGAQPHAVSRVHLEYARQRGCVVRWYSECRGKLLEWFSEECERLAGAGCQVYVTIDADAVRLADVPGVSAPNVSGFSGEEVLALARRAGQTPAVASLDVVEINPRHDRDGQSVRWGAVAVWSFLAGLALRQRPVS